MENLYWDQLDNKAEQELLAKMHQLAIVAQNLTVSCICSTVSTVYYADQRYSTVYQKGWLKKISNTSV